MELRQKAELTLDDLEKLASEKNMFLWDTSAILGALFGLREVYAQRLYEPSIIEKTVRLFNERNFFNSLSEILKRGANFYTTQNILNELSDVHKYSLKRKLKERGGRCDRKVIDLMRQKKGKEIERFSLINLFSTTNKVLELSEEELKIYNQLFKEFEYLKYKRDLNYTDWDLLLSGVVVSKTRCPCFIVSNDFPIAYALTEISRKLDINSYQLGFFQRVLSDCFQAFDF